MTTIALNDDPVLSTPALPGWLRRLSRRIAAYSRRRHYPSVRRERSRAAHRWASDFVRQSL